MEEKKLERNDQNKGYFFQIDQIVIDQVLNSSCKIESHFPVQVMLPGFFLAVYKLLDNHF